MKYKVIFLVVCLFYGALTIAAENEPTPTKIKVPEKNNTAQNWPSFRGAPNNPGNAPGNISDKPTLKWKFKTGGMIKGTPVIYDGKVYFGSEDKKFYCLELKTGKKLWEQELPDIIESSPLYIDKHLIVGTSDGDLFKLKADDGEKVWHFKADDRFASAATYFMKDGKPIIIAGNYDNNIYALSFDKGEKVWAFETENYINGTPAVYEKGITFGGCDNIMYVLSKEGKLIHEIDLGSYIAGTVAIENGQAYIGHYEHKYYRIDIAKEKIVWEFKKSNFPFFSSAAIAKDRIIFGGRDRKVYALNKETGKELWNFKTKGKVDSSPLICGNKVAFGSYDGRVYILNTADGKQLWKYDIGKPILAAPAIVDGYLLIGSSDGSLYTFK